MQELQNKHLFISATQQSVTESLSNSSYELAIVGSGTSCAYTLIHYLSLLSEKLATARPESDRVIKIAVFDKSGEFWKGVPYGNRSGKQSLIITPLKEFLPQAERNLFVNWLKNNNQLVLDSLRSSGDSNTRWLESYSQAIEQNCWDELYVPRYLFGWYLYNRVTNLLEDVEIQKYVRCELITGNVIDIQKRQNVYQIDTVEGNSLVAEKVVLAIGSPPNKAAFLHQLEDLEQSGDRNSLCCIANMYEPTQDENIERIQQHLQNNNDRTKQVLIIGSNASALETIYSLSNRSEVAALIDRYVVISPSGEFPHRITDTPTSQTFVPQKLNLLIQQSNFTAKQIYEAVKEDVEATLSQGETINSTYGIISRKAIEALNMLDYEEQKQFVTKYGVKIGKFQRRAGSDYLNVAERLILEGKLELIKGKFAGIKPLTDDCYGFEYATSFNKDLAAFERPVRVIINCAGFQNLTKSSSPLINNLIERGICIPNDSQAGFKINENFEASENLYLMGPLVAGNINAKMKVWHAESCGRIFNLSQSLAPALI